LEPIISLIEDSFGKTPTGRQKVAGFPEPKEKA